ncbi:MAG: 2-C-methyl-D-erythritol 4-phosphate cytidylyltransferase [Butyricicoccus pullicaecorum]|nr:2-C-methyl-D-erythritol 4-phosphate cytidylyltransferase [Butyricicoccus pullicaecorum]
MFRKNKKNTEPLPTVAAIIPAAGSSTRMGQNKLMLPLMDIPVLAHTISAFERCPLVRDIILVCREQDILPYSKLITDFAFHKVRHVLRGGQTRAHSVLAGLHACAPDIDFVAIHDGARPLVSDKLILQTLQAAFAEGAAAPVVPVKDSVKHIQNGKIIADVPRDSIAAVQTPQVFRRSQIADSLREAIAANAALTDDCAAVERIGVSVTAVSGEYRNLKITTPEDITIAELFLTQEDV